MAQFLLLTSVAGVHISGAALPGCEPIPVSTRSLERLEAHLCRYLLAVPQLFSRFMPN
jgi:hypothetical protein